MLPPTTGEFELFFSLNASGNRSDFSMGLKCNHFFFAYWSFLYFIFLMTWFSS